MDHIEERRAFALAEPCARAAFDPRRYGWAFRHDGRDWTAILTINR